MSSPTRARYHMRRLDAQSLTAFVADLYATRGWTTRIAAGVVVAERRGERLAILPVPARRFRGLLSPILGSVPDRAADVVVTPADPDGWARRVASERDAELIVGDALAERLWYGVDAAERARLCERHFDAPPEALRRPPSDRVVAAVQRCRDATVAALDASPRRRRAATGLAVVVALAAVLAAGAAFGVATPAGPDESDVVDATRTASTPTSPVTVAFEQGPDSVPGLSASRVTDVDRLAAAHDAALVDTAHRFAYVQVRPRLADWGPDTTRWAGTVARAEGRVTRQRFRCDGPPSFTDVYVDDGRTYTAHYDGVEVNYTAANGTTSATAAEVPSTTRLVKRYFAVRRTSVENVRESVDDAAYRITARGNPPAGQFRPLGEYVATALVTEDGLVTRIRIAYAVQAGNETLPVRVAVDYGSVGRAEANPPVWYDPPLRNGTMNGTENLWYYMKSASRRHCRSGLDEPFDSDDRTRLRP